MTSIWQVSTKCSAKVKTPSHCRVIIWGVVRGYILYIGEKTLFLINGGNCAFFTFLSSYFFTLSLTVFPQKWCCCRNLYPTVCLDFYVSSLIGGPEKCLTLPNNQQPNYCLLMQAPSDTNRVNITQLQAMSNTFLSCGLSPTQIERSPLPEWQCRDRLCLRSDLTSSPGPRPWPRCDSPDALSKLVRHDRNHCSELFEIKKKEGAALTLYVTSEVGALIICHGWELEQDVFADICSRCQREQISFDR